MLFGVADARVADVVFDINSVEVVSVVVEDCATYCDDDSATAVSLSCMNFCNKGLIVVVVVKEEFVVLMLVEEGEDDDRDVVDEDDTIQSFVRCLSFLIAVGRIFEGLDEVTVVKFFSVSDEDETDRVRNCLRFSFIALFDRASSNIRAFASFNCLSKIFLRCNNCARFNARLLFSLLDSTDERRLVGGRVVIGERASGDRVRDDW